MVILIEKRGERRPSAQRRMALMSLVAAFALSGLASAKPWWTRGVESNEGDFLDPDLAFKAGFRVDGALLRVRWVIADGYYLYRQKMTIEAESPDLVLGPASFPPGIQKTDPYLGTQEIFLQQVEATVPYTRSDGGAHPLQIKVTYQGCATAGLCYPPISKVLFAPTRAPLPPTQSHPWEGVAIVGGGLAFLAAGLLLRKGRRLDTPAV
jgi:thiol:disulfide interchange protein DsbD